MTPILWHITTDADWQQAIAHQEYRCASLASEGFIHCCTREQMAGVCDRYFPDRAGLLVLKIEVQRLGADLRWECLPGSGEEFPHLYGPLNLDAVVEVVSLEFLMARNATGS